MKKKVLSLLLLLILCLALTVPAFAADAPRLVDGAKLLTAQQAEQLEARLNEISENRNFDVVIVTLESLEGADPEAAAEYFYEKYGYGYGPDCDGVVLLISMAERDWVITSTGFGQTALNADARGYISDSILSNLSAGNYADAFNIFASCCDSLVFQAASGKAYKEPFPVLPRLFISLAISLIVALIATSVMKGKLKSVQKQYAAADYVTPGSLNLTESRDRFLYANVTRTAKPQNNSSSGSRGGGGGMSHSSSHGKF